MKYILSIIICLALFSCHDVKVGYLETEAAQYNPNVLEVTKSQDANDPLHVVSPLIEGVEGTQPIYITIRQVTTTDGDKVAFLKEITVRGNGAFDIPVFNNIPAGTYQISLQVENEDYSDILEDIFTIVVKE